MNTQTKPRKRQSLKNFKTIAYAGDFDFLKSLTDQLDQLDMLQKSEDGSRSSSEGHTIKYFVVSPKTGAKKDLFFAMIGTHGKYLIRADKNLFEEA